MVEPIDSRNVGIDNSKKTLALEGVNGAFVQITSSEIRIIPTIRFTKLQTNQT
jgi:hypothetical protein